MAGSITSAAVEAGAGVAKYTIAWTTSAGGVVSGNSLTIRSGHLRQAKFIPGAGGNAPTDLYDVTALDADGVDILLGLGADRSATAAQIVPLFGGQGTGSPGIGWFEGGNVTPTIANAGNAKTGTLILYVGP